jgi:hypothetical protein
VRLTELGRRNEDDSRATSGRVRRGTESHESWPTWRQGGPPPICSREGVDHKADAADESQARRGRLRSRRHHRRPSQDGGRKDGDGRMGDQVELREGFDRQPASRGAGPGGRFNNRVFEVQRRAPPRGGMRREGQGGAGCRREGARARRSVRNTPGRARRTGLAAGARKRSRGAW